MLEQLIAYHGGPALAGIKPANIVSVSAEKYPALESDVKRLNSELNPSGIYFEILCRCRRNFLLMVYRKSKLEKYLSLPEIEGFLADSGYPSGTTLNGYMDILKNRIKDNTEFPHEIGAFLGYPIEDIEGFIYHKNEGCIYTGYWRVYENAEPKIRLFERYDICRKNILQRVCGGKALADIFRAA